MLIAIIHEDMLITIIHEDDMLFVIIHEDDMLIAIIASKITFDIYFRSESLAFHARVCHLPRYPKDTMTWKIIFCLTCLLRKFPCLHNR